MTLKLVPVSIREANLYVLHHHRHSPPTQGALFTLGAEKDGQLVGVALVGRPPRGLQDGRTVEIRRVCTDGTRNACSFLYARCRDAARALGYDRPPVTYTRQDESGASLRASGFVQEKLLPARSWAEDSVSRERFDRSEPAARIRWRAVA
jgi:hypothetical protein